MDDDALRMTAREHIADARKKGETVFSRRRVIAISDMFGEKPMHVAWRMEKLGLLRRGSYAWFKANGGITPDHVTEARVDRAASHCTHTAYTMDKATGDCTCDQCGKLLIDCLGRVLEH